MEAIFIGLDLLTGTPLIFVAIAGVGWGILGGALPGISPSIAMALLLPLTYGMEPGLAIVLLAATYVGAEYGGSIPAILINTPGTNAAAATVLDGYELQRQGRGGEALGISLYSGVIGAFFGLAMLMLLTRPLAEVALAFTPMAYFALGLLGLSVIVSLSGESLLKGLAAALLGLMVATVGSDPISGMSRFTFGQPELLDGIAPILIMVGLFAVSELLRQASISVWEKPKSTVMNLKLPNGKMRKRLFKPQLIGSIIGTIEGVMPGAGGTIASFMSYNEARRWSRFKSEFGNGSPEGIAAPETANNAACSGSFVPMLTLGIPGSGTTAVMLGALLGFGIQPGPRLYMTNPEIFWSVIMSMYIGMVILLILNLPLIPYIARILAVPKNYLIPLILFFSITGIYVMSFNNFDIYLMIGIAVVATFMRLYDFPMPPLILAFVLGGLMEENLRRSLLLSDGSWTFLWDRTLTACILATTILIVGWQIYKTFKKKN